MSRWAQYLADHQLSPVVKEMMRKEYGVLLYVAGVFINYDPKYVWFSFALIFILLSNDIVYIGIFIVTAFKAPSLIALSQYLNYLSLDIISIGMYFSILSYRYTIVRQLEIMANDFYDYGSSFVNEEEKDWKKSLRSFKIIVLIGIPTYLGIIGICVLFASWIDLIFGYEREDVDYKNGIYQRLPIALWYPFVIDNNLKRALAAMGQIVGAGALSLSLGTADVLMLMLGQTVCLQMRILCKATVNMDDRADRMYRELTKGSEPSKDPFERSRDKVLEECYRRAIRQLVEHHLIIQQFYDSYNQLAKWPAGFAVLNGSVMIALSIMVISTGTSDRPSTYINAGLLLVAEVTSMWLLCETGQQVNTWSEQLCHALYEFDWPSLGPPNKKLLLIFKEKTKYPLVMMAGGLTPITRDTFATIMNTAYSYVNLLRASEKN